MSDAEGYYRRLDELLATLREYESVHCSTLSDRLGWRSDETRAKLMTLRRDGKASYEAARWRAIQ